MGPSSWEDLLPGQFITSSTSDGCYSSCLCFLHFPLGESLEPWRFLHWCFVYRCTYMFWLRDRFAGSSEASTVFPFRRTLSGRNGRLLEFSPLQPPQPWAFVVLRGKLSRIVPVDNFRSKSVHPGVVTSSRSAVSDRRPERQPAARDEENCPIATSAARCRLEGCPRIGLAFFAGAQTPKKSFHNHVS